MLLADAEVSVQQFDARLRQLQRERIRVQVCIGNCLYYLFSLIHLYLIVMVISRVAGSR